METTITIDVATTRQGLSQYDDLPPMEIGVGTHKAKIVLINVPTDRTEEITNSNARYEAKIQQWREANYKLQEQVHAAKDKIAAYERSTSGENDAPRPALSDVAVRELLAYARGADFTQSATSVVVTRLVTGWPTPQAQAFVNATV